jgi:hypothetical protein
MNNIRWFSTCNRDGVWSQEVLQVWDKGSRIWVDVKSPWQGAGKCRRLRYPVKR